MAPDNSDSSNASLDEFNFTVEFRPTAQLPKTSNPETEWETLGIPSVPHSATINSLLDRVKKHVQDYLQGRSDFERKGIEAMMKNITSKYNADKDDSEKLTKTATGSFDSRFPNILDLTTDVAAFKQEKELKLIVHVEAERDVGRPIDDLDQDENLDRFIYPRRPNITYVKVGSVQNSQKRPEKFDLLQAKEDEEPIQRKNIILAQYDAVNDDVMSDNFKVLGSWRFMSPDNNSVFFRIGDFAGAQIKTMQDLTANHTLLSGPYQVKDANGKNANPNVGDLRDEVKKKMWDPTPPVLPTLTLNPFPNQDQLTNAEHRLRKIQIPTFRVVVKFLYLAPSLNLDETTQRRPRNLQIKPAPDTTFYDLECHIFEKWNVDQKNADDKITAEVDQTKTKLVWWIMHNEAEGQVGKMYKVEDDDTELVKYVESAKQRVGGTVILYTECHVREKDAPDEYTAEGL